MPRLPVSLLRRARSINGNLVPLLRATRDLSDAKNELRWLAQHLASSNSSTESRRRAKGTLREACLARGRGTPLQYVLGTEFFGDLEIGCKEGVLIPRQDTAASIAYLAQRLQETFLATPSGIVQQPLKFLDLCTGTACIPLLLNRLFRSDSPQILAVDVSSRAVSLAQTNVKSHKANANIVITRADILPRSSTTDTTASPMKRLLESLVNSTFDIVTANPPYISSKSFASTTTARSVRNFEPRLALVPPNLPACGLGGEKMSSVDEDARQADGFYPAILDIADRVNAKVLWMEVADLAQALRVIEVAARRMSGTNWDRVEIWRDEPDITASDECRSESKEIDGRTVPVVGRGNGRAVVCWRV